MTENLDNNDGYVGTLALNRNELLLPNYNKYITSLIISIWVNYRQQIESNEYQILDFGAGLGTISIEFQSKTSNKVQCFEIDDFLVRTLKEKNLRTFTQIEELKSKYDLIYSSNVLEHIEDDINALKSISNKLKPNGNLILFVPAFNLLFSKIDTELGHFRRYTISDLTAKMQTAGFEIQDARYCDSMGFLAWFSVKILKIGQKMDRRVSLGMKIFDKLILPISIKIDQVFPRIPFGKNLLIIGIKKGVLLK